MKFTIGDKVRFLNDVGDGVVVRVMPNNLVYVQDQDGFEFPVKSDEIIKITNEGFEEERETAPEPAGGLKASDTSLELSDVDLLDTKNTEINALLALVPNRENNLSISDLDLHLINDSNYGLLYHVGLKHDNNTVLQISVGMLEDNTKVYLQSFSQSDLSKAKKLVFQVIPFGQEEYILQEPINKEIDLSVFDFYRAKTYKENDYFEAKAIILPQEEDPAALKEALEQLSNSDINAVIKEKGDVSSTEPKKKKKEDSAIEEVDLHIHEIMDDYKDLSNGEIIQIQLDRFETSLMTALNSQVKKIVFIHGVGNGKLKHELRKKLERKYPKLEYQDASFREYGYGATMVMLR
ncbi:MAG: DUF2027 domain-containing protein [Bacteroidota bacterium]